MTFLTLPPTTVIGTYNAILVKNDLDLPLFYVYSDHGYLD